MSSLREAALPRRPAMRQGLSAVLLVALAASLPGCGGGGGGGAAIEPPAEPPAGGRAEGLQVSAPGELLAWAQARLRAAAVQGPVAMPAGAMLPASALSPSAEFVLSSGGAAAGSATAAPVFSDTVRQEVGVDEADLLRTDGDRLFTLHAPAALPQTLRFGVHLRDAAGRAQPAGALTLVSADTVLGGSHGMYLTEDRRSAAVLTQRWSGVPAGEGASGSGTALPFPGTAQPLAPQVSVQRIDVADAAAPRSADQIAIEGQLVDSRRIGNRLYLVTTHQPVLPLYALPAGATAAEREASIAALRTADLLPRVRRNGGAPVPLLADSDCFVQKDNASASVGLTAVTVIDLGSAGWPSRSRCVVGGSEAVYVSAAALYIATTRWEYPVAQPAAGSGAATLLIGPYPASVRTDIHKFALDDGGGATVSYRGSGSVEGHLGWDPERKPLRLSEHRGDLRVLSYTGPQGWFSVQDAAAGKPASPALLTVLRERAADRTLQPLATLPSAARPAPLGKPGEQVYGVRFVGDRGYVVTFRRTDPLYVLDLADAADPKLAGELEVPGFSDHLFPFDGGLLLGVGRSADDSGRAGGLKVALYDVADPARPREAAAWTLGAAGSRWALEQSRHAVNWTVQGGRARVALPAIVTADATGSSSLAQRGLQRLEIDLAARTLVPRPAVGVRGAAPWIDLSGDRSVQIGAQVHYLADGALGSHDW